MTDNQLMKLIESTNEVIEKSKNEVYQRLSCYEANEIMIYIVMKEMAEELLATRKIIISQSLKEASC